MLNKLSRHDIKESLVHLINKAIEEALLRYGSIQPLNLAIRHALLPGGKRIRPLFCLMLFHDLGFEAERLILPATALEIVHASSLVHDDLPALDNDDMRRGLPSVHKAFGEATAILTGDSLLALAYLQISESELEASVSVKLIQKLSIAFRDLCNGQQLDLLPPTARDLVTLHRMKTGALFRCCFEFAAIAAKFPELTVEKIAELGLKVGVGFQMVDDLLDVIGKKGRGESSDLRNKKSTLFAQGKVNEGYDEIATIERQILTEFEAVEAVIGRHLSNTRELVTAIFNAA